MKQVVPGDVLPLIAHNSVATSSSLRFWARAIGERNPRYVDDSETRTPSDGNFEAHPCWLYSVHDTVVHVGGAQLVPVVADASWTFHRAVRCGDIIRPQGRLISERQVSGQHAGLTLVQVVEVDYLDVRDEVLATTRTTLFHIDPVEARKRQKYAAWVRTRYTEEQLLKIEAAYDAEDARPRHVRYIDDLTVGEDLEPIVRGPVTSEEMTMFVGATRPIPGLESFTRARLAGEMPSFIHPRSGTYETYGAGCVDDTSAQQLGFPAAHDLGIDRVSYAASLPSSWMGPRGSLRSFEQQLLVPVMLGDTSWCRGRVVAIEGEKESRRGVVVLEVWTENQFGVVTGRGTARVELDRRVGEVA
ncbi:MaoC family dehydratase N-terminal domain-containing protein [Diaminobutyricimonas sp. LJ205]|uniref:FAS1-like dehydratase domain-containing protein n=1 Tax=Diaminobutyricimonas sp. LJ205 TaxID=2683590 RepID=UPI0012F52402|nr:MaoC family dehydratase N-terminal domain-containing protein [Diaminobutyricimonas sp. LJ205]